MTLRPASTGPFDPAAGAVARAPLRGTDVPGLVGWMLDTARARWGAAGVRLYSLRDDGWWLEAACAVQAGIQRADTQARRAAPDELPAALTGRADAASPTHALALAFALRTIGALCVDGAADVGDDVLAALFETPAVLALVAADNHRLRGTQAREREERELADAANLRTQHALRESESRLRRMAETASDVIWITDLEPERVVYVSPSFERIWGLSCEALYRDPHLWVQGIHPDDRARVGETFGAWIARTDDLPWEAEFRVVRPDGSIRWIHDRGARSPWENTIRVSGMSTDITERRAAEEALLESQTRFALAVEASNDGIWDWDIARGLMFMAQRTQRLYGLEPGATLRPRDEWRAKIRLHPDDAVTQRALIDGYLAGTRDTYSGEWRVLHPDGEYRWVGIRGLCVRDAAGRPVRMAGSVTDIDARRRAEVALRQAQRLEAVGTLAGGVAHDFNNILGAILGFGEMALRNTRPGSRARRDVELIVRAGERGRALVERILAFSRFGASQRVEVDAEALASEALQLIAATLPANVSVRSDLRCGGATAIGDPTQVHQVLMNLMTNAVQAMPDGGELGVATSCARLEAGTTVTTGKLPAGNYVALRVSDTGQGIAPDVLPRIFDPFFTTKDVGAGTGLGLSLVHGIVAEHEGGVSVESGTGRGSVFTVWLPRGADRRPASVAPVVAPARGGLEQILVVDDDDLVLTITLENLTRLGYMPVGFASSRDALAAFSAHPERFDAVVTDARMPGLSGAALIASVRDLRPAIPVLMVSGYPGQPGGDEGLVAGADAVLRKPVLLADLGDALAALMHGRR